MLTPGDRIELVANSDGLGERGLAEVSALRVTLEARGLHVTQGLAIDRSYGESLTPPTAHPVPDDARAEHLMASLEDPEIAAVFDVSGGSLATGVLSYLDPERLARTQGYFVGFSNLTTIANAIYASGGGPSLLLNPRLLGSSPSVRDAFTTACFGGSSELPAAPGSALVTPEVTFARGTALRGTVVGGNLTAILTLVGTPWFPPLEGSILAIEAMSPSYTAIAVGLHQLRQMGVFERVSGVLLGQFTAVDREHGPDAVPQLAREIIPVAPVATTRHFGHSSDSLALAIGEKLDMNLCSLY